MNLSNMHIGPAVTGIIRIDSERDHVTGELKTLGQIGVYSKVHEAADGDKDPVLAKHDIEPALLSSHGKEGKLVEVPIRMFFNKASNGLKIGYQAFDQQGKPMCSGDGKNALRRVLAGDGTETLSRQACPGSESCEFGNSDAATCRRQMKMNVQIKGHEDPLGSFEVRSTSINSYRTMAAQLKMLEAACGGLRHVPLLLQLEKMSNQLSGYQPFDTFKLRLDARDLADAVAQAKQRRDEEAKTCEGGLDLDEIFFPVATADAEGEVGEPVFEVDFEGMSDAYAERPARRRSLSVAQAHARSGGEAAATVAQLMTAAVDLDKKTDR